MATLVTLLNLASAFAAFVAAGYWWASTRIEPPKTFGWGVAAPNDWQTQTAPGVAWAAETARMNKLGAGFAGIAAALMGAATLLSEFGV